MAEGLVNSWTASAGAATARLAAIVASAMRVHARADQGHAGAMRSAYAAHEYRIRQSHEVRAPTTGARGGRAPVGKAGVAGRATRGRASPRASERPSWGGKSPRDQAPA